MKQEYGLYETILNLKNIFLTKLFWRNARLIRYPFFMRGKRFFSYQKGLTLGYFCRFEAYSLPDDTEEKKIVIGENCKFGDRVHISACSKITIADSCLFASNILVTDNEHGDYSVDSQESPYDLPDQRPVKTKPVVIGENTWDGENVVILPGSSIGKGCVIGANSVVKGVFPDYCIIAGSPAKIVKRYSFDKKVWEKV